MSGRKVARHVALSPERSKALGDRLRGARAEARLTQEALAETSRIGTEHIQRIERGVSNPTLGTLYALADALRLDTRSLLPD